MVSSDEITLYRSSVVTLIRELRTLVYIRCNNCKRFPTDLYLSGLLGLSSTAFSSICRGCSSMSGVTLQKLMFEIAKLSAPGDFATTMSEFVKPYFPK